jgi:eukaryotic-like serine/threonine-protein kinase
MGTPLYMSPEQVQGQPIDSRSDIYSFGVTAYHVLAGEPPYQGNNPYDVALKHVTGNPVPLHSLRPDLPPELCAIVYKMMAKDPAQRYQTSRDLLRDLVQLREAMGRGQPGLQTQLVSLDSLPSLPAVAPVSGPHDKPPAPPRQVWRWLWPLSLVLAAACGGAAAWLVRLAETAPPSQAPLPGDLSALEVPETLADREQRLRANARQFSHPNSPNQVKLGLGHAAELGVFLLDQRRLKEADEFFTELDQLGQEVKSYLALGRLGHAVVLALNDEPAESNRLFHEVITSGRLPLEGFKIWDFLNDNPQLRMWISTAIEHNLTNSPQHPFTPEQLNVLHPERPTRWLAPPNRSVVPPGDKPPKPPSP